MSEQAERFPTQGNAERLNKVADVIQANPAHFDMGDFLCGPGAAWSDYGTRRELLDKSDLFLCGTQACIAGWACYLWPAEVENDGSWSKSASRILGLSDETAADLFYDFDLDSAHKAADRLRRMALAIEDAS